MTLIVEYSLCKNIVVFSFIKNVSNLKWTAL